MRKTFIRILPLALCLLFFFIVPLSALHAAAPAADPYGLRGAAGNDLPQTSLIGSNSIIAIMIFNVLGMVGVIFLILMITGGLMWMLSGGNEQKVTKAKGILTTATVGLIIVLTAYSVTYFITQSLVQQIPSNPPQNIAR